jgi:hypothetical protein
MPWSFHFLKSLGAVVEQQLKPGGKRYNQWHLR